jgi:apolipoprotein N-acyltransferase
MVFLFLFISKTPGLLAVIAIESFNIWWSLTVTGNYLNYLRDKTEETGIIDTDSAV